MPKYIYTIDDPKRLDLIHYDYALKFFDFIKVKLIEAE